MKRRSIILFVIISVICIITPHPSAALKAKGKGEQLLDYDNPLMGVKFSYPANWHISSVHTGYESSRCTEPDIDCYLKLNRYPYHAYFDIRAQRGERFEQLCSCNSLTEFVRWHYNNIQKELSFSFTNDSKIILGGNIPAWKIEYNNSALGSTFDIKTLENRPEKKTTNHIDILTIVNGTYYIIAYSGFAYPDSIVPGKDGDFSKFLSAQNDMTRSVHFIPVRQITAAEIPSYVPPTEKAILYATLKHRLDSPPHIVVLK